MIEISEQELLARYAGKQLVIEAQGERIAQLEVIVENQRIRILELEAGQADASEPEPNPEGEADDTPP